MSLTGLPFLVVLIAAAAALIGATMLLWNRLANEGGGMPLSLLVTAANTPDAAVFEALLDDIPKVRTRLVGGAAAPANVTPTRPTTTGTAAPT